MSIKNKYKVCSIVKNQTHDWLLNKHYAKRIPAIEYAFGLFDGVILVGVMTFGQPPSPSLKESICGKEYSNLCIELNRLVVNDGLEKNTLSYFVSQSLKMIPSPRIIVSFSDINKGHQGYIYQATNWIYTGLSTNDEMLVDIEGKEVHFRTLGHLRKDNSLGCTLIKRRINESELNRLDIANYLRANKGSYKAKQLDAIFGYKDTAGHWFRTDKGFSFPSVDDWMKLKELFGFDNSFDEIMTKYELVPDRQEQIKKLGLSTKKIEKKHRYIFFIGNNSCSY